MPDLYSCSPIGARAAWHESSIEGDSRPGRSAMRARPVRRGGLCSPHGPASTEPAGATITRRDVTRGRSPGAHRVGSGQLVRLARRFFACVGTAVEPALGRRRARRCPCLVPGVHRTRTSRGRAERGRQGSDGAAREAGRAPHAKKTSALAAGRGRVIGHAHARPRRAAAARRLERRSPARDVPALLPASSRSGGAGTDASDSFRRRRVRRPRPATHEPALADPVAAQAPRSEYRRGNATRKARNTMHVGLQLVLQNYLETTTDEHVLELEYRLPPTRPAA